MVLGRRGYGPCGLLGGGIGVDGVQRRGDGVKGRFGADIHGERGVIPQQCQYRRVTILTTEEDEFNLLLHKERGDGPFPTEE